MKKMKMAAASAAAIAIATGLSGAAFAQSTTADIRGAVTDTAGAPVSGAVVTITDMRTGTTRTVRTGSNGGYAVRGLDVSGDYSVKVDTDQYADETVSGIRLSLGDTTVVNFDLEGSAGSDEIVVVATRSTTGQLATGPAASFDLADLQESPAIDRDIKDILRTDPRIFIDESFGNGLQCAGASPRFNSLTVDGIRLNDNFGLNANGYPTERLPFPYDAINQVAVELAPFDVEYGGFTGCNINAVTRSGSNEFHGSAWGDWTSNSLRGGSIEGSSFDKGDYDEFRFGATIAGPILKDRLFFFAAYEKINETEVLARGPADAGAIGVQGVSQAQLDLIASLAQSLYGITPTPLPASYGEDDEKILVKLDLNITDNHRASFTYNHNNGFNLTGSDTGPTEYEFFDHYYLRSTKLVSYSGQIFSDWTDNFSTELRVSQTTNDTGQNSVNGTDVGEIQIRTFNNGQSATVYLGADDSRHSNKLDTKTLNIKFVGDYDLNEHHIKFGYERERVEVFNLFIQHTEGEYRFDRFSSVGMNPNSNIDDFAIGLIDDIFYGNAVGSNNPDDGAANFAFTTNSAYIQDQWSLDQYGLTLTAGLRYDWYSSKDVPAYNANFEARNGYANTETFDGRGIIQPRFGFEWEALDNLRIHGGGGIFSGGNPNVWLSNSYQNDSITTLQRTQFDVLASSLTWVEDEGGMGRPFWGVPQNLYNDVANGTAANGGVNAVDPDFDIPSQWKAAIGAVYDFSAGPLGQDYTLMVDFLYTKDRAAAAVVDATLEQIGTAPDGRPIYKSIDRADPDCVTPAAAACDTRAFNQDFILTNNDGGEQKVLSAALSKRYDFDNNWRANWTLAYAFVDAKDRNPMTSSVAFSNFANFSTTDPNHPELANSNYEVPHRITLRAGAGKMFFGDYETKINLTGVISQSRPYSFVFGASGDAFGDTLDNRHLLYVPTGPSDPNVIFVPGFDTATFFNVINDLGLDKYAGGIVPRNEFQSDWYSQWDIRIEQEIPGILGGHRGSIFVVLDNVGNLINDKWGVINQAGFPGNVQVANINEAASCAQCAAGSRFGPNGEYIFTGFNNISPDTIQSPITNASVWEIRFGVRYSF
ncbi:MAG: carboxypeptidase regulatory-like domain-containing protein [Pseudomonadota bacterium]|nr:carboxypeptidase regulatory-like domain-containing protein [Pseudomonadota bacterium]